MFPRPIRKDLIADLDFRRFMKDASASEVALPRWVLKQLVKNTDFFNIIAEQLTKAEIVGMPDSAISRLLHGPAEPKRNFFESLLAPELSLRYLIGELITRYNNRFSVLSGLKALLKKKPDPPKIPGMPPIVPEELQTPPENGDGNWVPNFSRVNPLLNVSLASLLSAGTVTSGVAAYKYIHQIKVDNKVENTVHVKLEPGAQNVSACLPLPSTGNKCPESPAQEPQLDARVRDEVLKQIKFIRDLAGMLTPVKSPAACDKCPPQTPTITGTLELKLPPKLPDLNIDSKLILPPTTGDGKGASDYNVKVTLAGLPEPKPFPTSFKLDSTPNYRLDNLPVSSTVITSKGSVTAWFPSSYDAAVSCEIAVRVAADDNKKQILRGEVQQPCKAGLPKQIAKSTFNVPIATETAWQFVPEIGASVKLEQRKTGPFWNRKISFKVSIQSASYSNVAALSIPNPDQGGSQGNGQNGTAAAPAASVEKNKEAVNGTPTVPSPSQPQR